jgi:hypothetical protein
MLPDAVFQKGERLEGVNAYSLSRARRSASTTILTTSLRYQQKFGVLLQKRNGVTAGDSNTAPVVCGFTAKMFPVFPAPIVASQEGS